MTYLVDTNILLRIANKSDLQHNAAINAVAKLHQVGERLAITAQNLIEFYSVATRPTLNNGLGLTQVVAQQEIDTFKQLFEWLNEASTIYPIWEDLIAKASVIGKQVHDTRLVAVCHAHGVTHLLTFNVKDFKRFQNISPSIIVVDAALIT